MDREFIVKCNDGCGIVNFSRDIDDTWDNFETLWMGVYVRGRDGELSTWENIKRTLKIVTSVLLGKSYLLWDISVYGDNLEEFKKNMKLLLDDRSNELDLIKGKRE